MGSACKGCRVGSAERVEAVSDTDALDTLRRAVCAVCRVIDGNKWILAHISQDERVALKDLAYYSGCTDMSWWDAERPEVR
jgi:hypothetical protein